MTCKQWHKIKCISARINLFSKTLDCKHNLFQKHACDPKHLYIKAKITFIKCNHIALFSFILSCDMTLLLYQDITCISRQNVLQRFSCLAKCSQTKLLSNQGFTVLPIYCSHVSEEMTSYFLKTFRGEQFDE